jgi:hypothetical protein
MLYIRRCINEKAVNCACSLRLHGTTIAYPNFLSDFYKRNERFFKISHFYDSIITHDCGVYIGSCKHHGRGTFHSTGTRFVVQNSYDFQIVSYTILYSQFCLLDVCFNGIPYCNNYLADDSIYHCIHLFYLAWYIRIYNSQTIFFTKKQDNYHKTICPSFYITDYFYSRRDRHYLFSDKAKKV